MVISGLSAILTLFLAWRASRRKAAVGRIELRLFLLAYALHSALTVITMSSVLQQGTTVLAVLSAIHVALVVAMFWILLGNALIATQIVEYVAMTLAGLVADPRDGTPAALVPLIVFAVLFFAPTLYMALDTGLHWTDGFTLPPNAEDARDLRATALFVLTLLWPAL